MALKSFLFSGNKALEDCAIKDPAHIYKGLQGEHVGKIQAALLSLESAVIDGPEWDKRQFGATTEKAVLAFKRKRKIINHAYESVEDPIVGKMTIAALDTEMVAAEKKAERNQVSSTCSCGLAPRVEDLFGLETIRTESRVNLSFAIDANAVTAPRDNKPKPRFIAGGNVAEGGFSGLGGINYQMIPVGGSRSVFADTKGLKCVIRAPANVTMTLNGQAAVINNGLIDVPITGRGVTLVITGSRPGKGTMTIRRLDEPATEEVSRDVLLSVKGISTVNVSGVFIVDALKRRSQYSAGDISAAMVKVADFLKRWANVNVVYNGAIEKTVDEDLSDVFQFRQRIALESTTEFFKKVGKQRVFDNPPDKARGPTNKVIYFIWKLPSDELVGVTLGDRIFLQNYGKDNRRLYLAATHELIHAMGQPNHSSQGLNIMATPIEAIGETMDHVDIETINLN